MTATIAEPKVLKAVAYVYMALFAASTSLPVPGRFGQKLAGSVGWLAVPDLVARAQSGPIMRLMGSQRIAHDLHHPKMEPTLRAIKAIAARSAEGRLAREILLPAAAAAAGRAVYVSSDASLERGVRAAAALTLFNVAVRISLPGLTGEDVPLLELFPLLYVAARYGPYLPGAVLISGLDAASVTFWANSLRARRPDAGAMLLALAQLYEQHGLQGVCIWLTRYANHNNDRMAAASSLEEARETVPHAVEVVGPATPSGMGATLQALVPGPHWQAPDFGK